MHSKTTTLEQMKELLEQGADPNKLGPLCTYPLHHANTEKTRLLLEYKADPNRCDREGATPLFYAAKANNTGRIGLLVNAGATANQCDDDGTYPIGYVASKGNVEAVKHMLRAGSPRLLHPAVYSNNLEIVQMCITRENVNVIDAESSTPLRCWCQHANPEILDVLLSYGADPHIKDEMDGTVMDWFLENSTYEIYQVLAKHKIDVFYTPTNALTTAIMSHNYEEAMKLADDADVSCGDHEFSVLYTLSKQTLSERPSAIMNDLFEKLIKRGVPVNTPPYSPLFKVECFPAFVKLLLSYGASVSDKNLKGYTALHLAAPFLECVKLLLEAKADPTVRANNFKTPAHLAHSTFDLLNQ